MRASHSFWDEQTIIKHSHVAGIHQPGHSLWLMAIIWLSLSLFSAVRLVVLSISLPYCLSQPPFYVSVRIHVLLACFCVHCNSYTKEESSPSLLLIYRIMPSVHSQSLSSIWLIFLYSQSIPKKVQRGLSFQAHYWGLNMKRHWLTTWIWELAFTN